MEQALKNYSPDSAEARCNHIHDMFYTAAIVTFGKRMKQNPDWFEAGTNQMDSALVAKWKPVLNYNQKRSEVMLLTLRKAKNAVQQVDCQCANDNWLNLCCSIQLCIDCGNIHGIFEGLKRVFGLNTTKMALLTSASGCIIMDHSKQMERWAENYQELYSIKNAVTETTIECMSSLPTMNELDLTLC